MINLEILEEKLFSARTSIFQGSVMSENLKVIEINSKSGLKRTPDFSKCLNLKRLVIRQSTKLLVVDGSLSKLEHLKHLEIISHGSLTRDDCDLCPVSFVSRSLKSLSELHIRGMHIRELHHSIGEMTRLKHLSLDHCSLLRTLPDSIGNLKMLMTMSLIGTPIKKLSNTIGKLESLPLDLSYLTNLFILHIWGDTPRLSEFKPGVPKIEWIEGLSDLDRLTIVVGDVTFPRINLATLSRLRILEITCVDTRSLTGLPSSLRELTLYNVKSPMGRSLFSNLTNMSSLCLVNCQLREVEFDDLLGQQLKKLRSLRLTKTAMLERLLVSRSEGLQTLEMDVCLGLMQTRGLEKLESLEAYTFGNAIP
ncbi:hypothetical protein EUGRSUZ_E02511 [Eucalyptus grandis]|uniref:Uncharacterized protein n=2 Tax=Eucalyptus grandis TaxID=71139 RepID=A0A059C6T8_EUCGR|nr:hypothetical protein EUGRSUZ_E02511 [Eucalyptus grandis]